MKHKKEIASALVAHFGGKCASCGYMKCPEALEFRFAEPGRGELILLCANCRIERGDKNSSDGKTRLFGEENGKTRVSTDVVAKIKEEYANRKETRITQDQLARKYNTSRPNISNIVSGKRRNHV